ncbi:MAG: hypothetical protein ABJG28_14810 [Nonlabens ulvanivorans]|uniref:hypothetical protein n=1 Tax=Nonlabens ulvanivorans TaxID=906888 RepID=UPI0032659C93
MTGALKTPDQEVEIPTSLIKIVTDVIAVAWQRLIQDYDNTDFCNFVEDEITEKLYTIIGEMDDDPTEELRGLAKLQSPVREGNIRNYNGDHIDKQPDLTWRPQKGLLGKVGNTTTAAIFVECKPVDKTHPIGSTYCKKGLVRFINGDYAWRVNRAIMVGYVRNLSKLPGVLEYALDAPEMKKLLGYSGSISSEKVTIENDGVWRTTHARKFRNLGNIQIEHLWLYTREPCENTTGRGSSL